MVTNATLSWPLAAAPAADMRIILASQGVRLWTAECRIASFNGSFKIVCADAATVENLARQPRIAFTIPANQSGHPIQGSGLARLGEPAGSEGRTIIIEPYRVSTGPAETYELQMAGWVPAESAAPPNPARLAFWYQAFRAVTLPMSALPVLVAGACAYVAGRFDWIYLVLSLVGTILAHAGANAAADYFDFKRGVDLPRALSSHVGALARERVEPELVFLAALGCFLGTAIIGLILVYLAGWQVLLFGLAGLLGAFFYTGRPLSYKYRALGELTLGILMGPVIVMGAYFLYTHGWDWSVFLISIALALLVSSVSLANNLRDLPDDREAGIRTLPMTLGVVRTKALYYILSGGPYLLAAGTAVLTHAFWPVLLVVISLPFAVKTIQALYRTRNDLEDIRRNSLKTPFPLNSIRLYTRFASLTVVGLVIAGLVEHYL